MTKWLKNILGLVIMGFLLWYLAKHWEQLKALLKLGPKQLVGIYSIWFLAALVSGRVVQHLLMALRIETSFWNMVWLQNATSLLNYVPMKFGTLFRANYLKRHYGLAYTHFATFFMYLTFLMTATAAVAGLTVLLVIFGLKGYENRILAVVFAITIICSILFLLVPLPVPKGQGWLSTVVRNFLSGRGRISQAKKAVFTTVILLAVNLLLSAVKLAVIYRSVGVKIHPGGYLILGALDFVVLFIGFTPGALGIRELVLSLAATVFGIPLQVGVLSVMIDRAIAVSYTFTVGGICAIWFWHKSPADFKEQQRNLLVQ